ncbi:MAG: carbonic anhydrase [Lachnospiraceae bacterium]|nr:carbonic anhydrase [Lachnospiraceae bacterium]
MNLLDKLKEGNERYVSHSDASRRMDTAENGQNPYAIIICCSDSRVIPEHIFDAALGDLFVIRVAGNVLDNHQLGSIEYAAAHLECKLIVMLGHTGCGAVNAALSGHTSGYISYITDDILAAAGLEREPDRASRLNVLHGVERIKREFAEHPEMQDVKAVGAIYDIKSGRVEWL